MDDSPKTPAQPPLPEVATLAAKLSKPVTEALTKAFAGLELDATNKKHQKLFLQAAISIVAQYAADMGIVSSRFVSKYSSMGAGYVARQLAAKLELTKPILTAVPDVDDESDEGDPEDGYDNKAED